MSVTSLSVFPFDFRRLEIRLPSGCRTFFFSEPVASRIGGNPRPPDGFELDLHMSLRHGKR